MLVLLFPSVMQVKNESYDMNHADIQCPSCGNAIIDEGVDTIQCPRCEVTFHRNDAPLAARRLDSPGLALIVTACLGFFGSCCLGLLGIAEPPEALPAQAPAGVSDGVWESYRNGSRTGRGLAPCCAFFSFVFIYPFVLIAGIQMRYRASYSLCILGSLLAMFPCSVTFLIGLPVGIWALSTLIDRDVREAFNGPTQMG